MYMQTGPYVLLRFWLKFSTSKSWPRKLKFLDDLWERLKYGRVFFRLFSGLVYKKNNNSFMVQSVFTSWYQPGGSNDRVKLKCSTTNKHSQKL